MDRLESLRLVVDDILRQQPDKSQSRWGFVHLYGVAQSAALLALQRGLDPEIASVAGMLHDIWSYKTGNSENHAELGSVEAGRILRGTGQFTDEEIQTVCTAIHHHSDKASVGGPYDEILKDADVLQYYLYNTGMAAQKSHALRRQRLIGEQFGQKKE